MHVARIRLPLVARSTAVALAIVTSACASAPASSSVGSRTDESIGAAATFNVMGPLVVGDPRAPYAETSEPAWQYLREQLAEVKRLGGHAISTDVWWGLVEEEGDQRFRWEYYDRLSDEILAAGLDWVPILSFHQCGGNVGDDCEVPIPSWLGGAYVARGVIEAEADLFYRSARGNVSREVLSAWATPFVVDQYRELMVAFQDRFSSKARFIDEINVSLGPAGELRFPSYNAHDPGGGFPTRGTLQSHGRLAVESFRRAMLERYGSVEAIASAWHAAVSTREDIAPPADGEAFFDRGDAFGDYGKDFLGWYQRSLLEHGRLVLSEAIATFEAEGAAFRGIDIGAKVPGIHWRVASDRYAEVTAGLLRSEDAAEWSDIERGAGYAPIVGLFEDVAKQPNAPKIVLHFTCLEMDDAPSDPATASRAKSLVFWLGKLAASRGVPIKGENALAGTLGSARAWENMGDALAWGGYQGLTVLRIEAVVRDASAQAGFAGLVRRFGP